MARITSLDEATAYLEGLIDFERTPDAPHRRMTLRPVTMLLERLGHPERGLSVIHVAGSKGKGSTCLLAESVLRAAGERVGTFTSPHLERWTERFRIDGSDVEDGQLAAAVERLRPHVEALRREHPDDAPTFFDATTAAALLLFAEAGLDRVLLEVGLGGRLDSTNAVTPAVTCVTSIELEHTDKLGGTLGEIAGEKVGILKPGAPCVVGRLTEEAAAVVRARIRELGIRGLELGVDFDATPLPAEPDETRLRYREREGFEVDASLSAAGPHQLANAALALACVRALGAHGDDAFADAARAGLVAAELPGRVEILSRAPWIVVDAAHTAASARALSAALPDVPPARAHLVLSISAGKDLGAILDALLPHAGAITLTRADRHRSLAPADVAAAVRERAPGADLRVVPNPHLAVRAAREALAPDGLLCVTGSVYLAGIARGVLRDVSGAVVVSRRGKGAAPTPGPRS